MNFGMISCILAFCRQYHLHVESIDLHDVFVCCIEEKCIAFCQPRVESNVVFEVLVDDDESAADDDEDAWQRVWINIDETLVERMGVDPDAARQ